MFFRNYGKAGPGISKDAPKKVGFALYSDMIVREFWTLLAINLMFLCCVLPVVTIGPGICAMNYVCAKIIRDEPVYIVSDFKRGFMMNLKQGLVVGIIVFVVSGALIGSFLLYKELIGYAAYVILALFIIFLLVNVYIFPLAANVNLPTKAIFKNSVLLVMMCIKPTLSSFAINLIIFIAALNIYPLSLIFYAIFGFSYLIFTNLFFAYPEIQKHAMSSDVTDEQ